MISIIQTAQNLRFNMKLYQWTTLCLALTGCSTEECPAQDKAQPGRYDGIRPNIIVILADDLGYADVGYHNCNSEIKTPNIDKMAAEGVHFTSAYVTNAVSSPSRAGLLSGRYQQSFGYEDNPGPFRLHAGIAPGFPENVTIMPQYLKQAGYVTGLIGKWHLGGEESNSSFPTRKGFDRFFGFLGGAANYYNGENEKKKIFDQEEPAKTEDRYFTDILGDKAIKFIQDNKSNPFYLYLSFNAVHGPLQVKDEILDQYSHIHDLSRRKLCAMQHSMDENVGKVMAYLKESGLDENTIVFFFSDNGGAPTQNHSMNNPFRGGKGTFFDGGIHSPFIIRWPDKIEAGSVYDGTISSMDILPTSMRLAGLDVPAIIDGRDLMPYILGEKEGEPHSCLCWKMNNKYAVRADGWKLVCDGGAEMLFNIEEDPYETTDLATRRPDKLMLMKERYNSWLSKLPPSLWGWQPGVGSYIQHPSENFENINKNWFEPLNDNLTTDIVENPLKRGANTSSTVFKIEAATASASPTGVRVNTGRYQQKNKLMHLKVLASEASDIKVIFLGDKNYTKEYVPVEAWRKGGEWQDLIFKIDFNQAVRNIRIVTKGLMKPGTSLYLDDLYFEDN